VVTPLPTKAGAWPLFRHLTSGVRHYRRDCAQASDDLSRLGNLGEYQKMLRDAHTRVTDRQWVRELPDLSGHLDTDRRTIAQLKQFADSLLRRADRVRDTASREGAAAIGVFVAENNKKRLPAGCRSSLSLGSSTRG